MNLFEDAYNKVLTKKKILEEVKPLAEKFSLEELKQKILNLLDDLKDYSLLNDILITLYKESFEETIDQIFMEKGIDEKTKKEFSKYFFSVPGSFDDKKEALDAIASDGILDGKKIAKTVTVENMLSDTFLMKGNPFIIDLYNELKQWKASLGAKSGVGKMEGLFVLFIKDAEKAAKGDIKWSGKQFEIKANNKKDGSGGGRLLGTSAEWGSTTKTYEKLESQMRNFEALAPEAIFPSDPNALNLLIAKIQNWNEILSDNVNNNIKFFKWMIKDMYTKASDSDLKWIKESLDKNGKMKEDFIYNFAVFQYIYYKKIEGFDAVLFVNLPTNKFITVYDEKTFKKLVISGKVNIGSFSWKEDRNIAYQVGLKG